MFRFFKRKKQHNDADDQSSSVEQDPAVEEAPEASEDAAPVTIEPDASEQPSDQASTPTAAPTIIDEREDDEQSFTETARVESADEQASSSSVDAAGAASEEVDAEERKSDLQREQITDQAPTTPSVEAPADARQEEADAPSTESQHSAHTDPSEPTSSSSAATDHPDTSASSAVTTSSERDAPSNAPSEEPAPVVSETPQQAEEESSRGGFFSRIRKGLSKTRSNLTGGLATLFLGEKEIDDELIEDLETQLLVADIGVEATTEIIDRLTERVSRKELSSASSLYKALQEELTTILAPVEQPLQLPPKGEGPFVILVIGVNGVGKTTTIGKLAKRYRSEGRSVMLAAGDTFRAAAVEQLKVWGERNDVPVVAQHTGADSASVIYDALSAARARNVDVLIADTAGRLHNKAHLMEELKKVRRVMGKLDDSAPHEVMLVVDAGTGQNAISQAETFSDAVPITGVVMTKLDGTAKGGVIFAMAKQTGIPIRYIGVGETLEDLRPFEAKPFTDALFDERA
ncbi:Signal recognition particle receptor FtsY [Carnimonas sp. R-84981]|uniref:signal recognition particle-docking protein FtsY n=1 Tax=Carnimonas bestiolae TaxID=3402172 RepID=UPI003EDC95A1